MKFTEEGRPTIDDLDDEDITLLNETYEKLLLKPDPTPAERSLMIDIPKVLRQIPLPYDAEEVVCACVLLTINGLQIVETEPDTSAFE